VEIVFDTTEETRVVRTTMLARAEGLGLWLAMPNTRFAREVKESGLVARKGRRVGSDPSRRYFFLFTGGARNDTLSPAAGSAACGSPRI